MDVSTEKETRCHLIPPPSSIQVFIKIYTFDSENLSSDSSSSCKFLSRVLDGLLLDTPCLKYLKLEDTDEWSRYSFSVEAMPDLEEAYVDLRYFFNSSPGHIGSIKSIERLMRSITSVKRLSICLEFVYGDGLVFNQLEHLKLCVCSRDSSNLLSRFLEDSPSLRVLDIFEMDHYGTHWEGSPTSVDESVESSLQDFDWLRYYERRPQEMDLEVYILGEKWSLKDCNNLA